MPRNMKKSKVRISKLQIFAIIVWVVVVSVVTYQSYRDYVASVEAHRQIIEDYLRMIGLTTGICMLAWGMPFPTLVKNISARPFEVGEKEKHPYNINPWLASFIAGGFFLFWVGASFDGRLYIGGFTAVGLWAILLTCVWALKRLFWRNKA